jgi:hypothetical protein
MQDMRSSSMHSIDNTRLHRLGTMTHLTIRDKSHTMIIKKIRILQIIKGTRHREKKITMIVCGINARGLTHRKDADGVPGQEVQKVLILEKNEG